MTELTDMHEATVPEHMRVITYVRVTPDKLEIGMDKLSVVLTYFVAAPVHDGTMKLYHVE